MKLKEVLARFKQLLQKEDERKEEEPKLRVFDGEEWAVFDHLDVLDRLRTVEKQLGLADEQIQKTRREFVDWINAAIARIDVRLNELSPKDDGK